MDDIKKELQKAYQDKKILKLHLRNEENYTTLLKNILKDIRQITKETKQKNIFQILSIKENLQKIIDKIDITIFR